MVTKIERPPAPASSPAASPAPAQSDQAGPPGGVESLDDLARAGAALDAPKTDPKAAQQVLASERAEIETALQLLRAAALPLAPAHTQETLAVLWSDKQLREIAEAIVECAKASGITVSTWFKSYGHWVRLGFALGMPAMATIKLLRMPAPAQADQVSDGQHESS